jgi:hypothetical protein
MLAIIPIDFDVSAIIETDEATLFAARRPDVWHFVLASVRSHRSNSTRLEISQFHFPRYVIARALASDPSQPAPALIGRLGLAVQGEGLGVHLRGRNYTLPETLVAKMRKDVPLLKRAAAEVQAVDGGFVVNDAVTYREFPVVTEQRCLADAIAFERAVRRKLDPRNFGVYSAFCTWRDFIRDEESKKHSIATSMAEEMISWDPDRIGNETYWASVFDIQERLWGARTWGPGVESEKDVLFNSFFSAFERLSSIQFAQFVLMNGMHNGGPFHALATLFGLMDFDGYKCWRSLPFQPDSPEEQEIRTHSAFIELLAIAD